MKEKILIAVSVVIGVAVWIAFWHWMAEVFGMFVATVALLIVFILLAMFAKGTKIKL